MTKRALRQPRLHLLLAALAAPFSCTDNDESLGTAESSLGEDDPRDHGADQPWVRCAHRIKEDGTDPLGPVISHGYMEAPGYSATAPPDLSQRIFTSRASLRRRDTEGPGAIHYDDLRLPNNTPSVTDVAHWVDGAIRLAGRPLPGTVRMTRKHETPTEDNGRPLDSYRIWDFHFEHQGATVAGPFCFLVAPAAVPEPATLSCRLSPTAPSAFESYTITDGQAKAIALAASSGSSISALSRRYYVDGSVGRARFVIVTDSPTGNANVLLDGAGTVLSVGSDKRHQTFDGVMLHYEWGLINGMQTTLHGIASNQTAHIDTAPTDLQYASPGSDNPCDWNIPAGFAVCGNELSGHSFVVEADPSLGEFTQNVLPPRPPAQDFTSVAFWYRATALGDAPYLPQPSHPSFALWFDDPSDENAGLHWAELQLFNSVGILQSAFENWGHPEHCAMFDNCDPGMQGQLPFRLKLGTHVAGVESSTTFNRMDVGDFADPTLDYAVEGVADGTLVTHEFNHAVLLHLEHDPKGSWEASQPGFCCDLSNALGCPRDALHEGLGDSFASLVTGRSKLLPSSTPEVVPDDPCDPSDTYPDNTLEELQRNACNDVVYDYWVANPDGSDPGCPAEIHRRGSVVFGALYKFQRRFLDSGFSETLPGTFMYQAQKGLTLNEDDERIYLDNLLEYIASTPYRRHIGIAQVAFAEKNVFQKGGGAECQGCTAAQDKELVQKSLAIGGPLMFEASSEGPTFQLMLPQQGTYQYGRIELSNNHQFNTSSGIVVTIPLHLPIQVFNNSPRGFHNYTVSNEDWKPVADMAEDEKVYYRLVYCASGLTDCVATTALSSAQSSVPYVHLGMLCAFREGPIRGGWGWLSLLGLLALVVNRRRDGACSSS